MNNFFNDNIKKEEIAPIQNEVKSNPFIETPIVENTNSTPTIKTKPNLIEKLSGVAYNPVNIIDLNNITQSYDNGKVTIFDDFTLQIKDITDRGQFVTILGQSGCGKCFTFDTILTIRNKKTNLVKNIKAIDFIKLLR